MCVLLVSLLWAESEWMFLCHYKINYEPGEYHTKSDRGRQIYDVTYTESKNTDTNEFLYKTETDSENELMVIRGRLGEGID